MFTLMLDGKVRTLLKMFNSSCFFVVSLESIPVNINSPLLFNFCHNKGIISVKTTRFLKSIKKISTEQFCGQTLAQYTKRIS